MKEEIEHRDKLNRLLSVGDCVAYPSHNTLEIGIIKKLHPKMVKVMKLKSKYKHDGSNKYSSDLVLLDGPDVTMYLIRNS
jgi:hypothetical protein